MFVLKLSKESKTIVLSDVELVGPSGTVSANFILDTGAACSVISWNIAAGLGFDLSHARTIPIVTGNGVVTAPLITVGLFSLGDIKVRNVLTICHDMPELIDGGLLGLSFLKHVRTIIDYRSLVLPKPHLRWSVRLSSVRQTSSGPSGCRA